MDQQDLELIRLANQPIKQVCYHRWNAGQRLIVNNKCSKYNKTLVTVINNYQGCSSLYLCRTCDGIRKLYQEHELREVKERV